MTPTLRNARSSRRALLMGAAALGGAALLPGWASAGQHVILGGGPAGVQAALRVKAERPAADVTLLERDPTQLGQRAARDGALVRPTAGVGLKALQDAGVAVVLDEAVEINWRAQSVSLFSGRSRAFDHLHVAPGTAPQTEGIAGLDPMARHMWPAAWGSLREAQRLQAHLAALPKGGHVVLRLPEEISHPEVVRARALWLDRRATQAGGRLSVVQAGRAPDLRDAVEASGNWQGAWHLGTQVTEVATTKGRLETTQGRLTADVVNFLHPQGAGRIAQIAALADTSGWCPVDRQDASTLQANASVLGDARKGAVRVISALL